MTVPSHAGRGALRRTTGALRRRGAARPLLVLLLGGALVLTAVTTARADRTQDRISAGSTFAAGRGTTEAIAELDRLTGQYRDNGALAHRQIESASVMKVFIAENLLHRRDLGQISLSAADMNDMTRMLRESYDAAANRFWSTFGANAIVSDVIGRYGLSETGLTSNVRYWGNTLITAHDMVVFYQRLLDGTGGLSAGSRDWIVDQMRHSVPQGDGGYQFFGLYDGLPREPVIAQKQGWMCCVNGNIYRHSTGFTGPDARFVVVALSLEPSTLGGAAHIEQSLTGSIAHTWPEGLVPRVQFAIGDTWYRMGGAAGGLGLPVTDEWGLGDRRGSAQWFQHGAIYWTATTGAHPVAFAVLGEWVGRGYEGGPLGYPITDEWALGDRRGVAQWFEHGAVYWSPTTGAHSVVHASLQTWVGQGYEGGPLGYPLTDEWLLGDGRGTAQWFEHGAIYSTATTGAHPLTGAILATWVRQGYEGGPLGYPTSDPYRTADGSTRVDFEHGSLVERPDGVVSTAGPATASASPSAPATTSTLTTSTATTSTATTTPATTTPATASTTGGVP